MIGSTLSIASNGAWNNSPLAYSDAWEDCYTYESKESCTAIPGAVNSTYTPQARDAGYTLRAQVTALNADGASVASTAASKPVAASTPAFLVKFGEVGESEKGQFKGPASDAIDASGDVWVIDRGNDRVEQWSASGTWLHTYGKKGKGSVQFESPEGIAINQATGDVYIADKANNRIEELNSKGEYVRAFGEKGSKPGQLNSPEGVAIDANGNVWVGDYANNRVDEFSETGEVLGSFGSEGTGNGQFKGPDGIAFSGANMYVVDTGNSRVQEFTMSGEFISKFGSKGTGEGQLETPAGISTEPVSGDLYVADTANNRVEEFNPAGTFLVSFGKKGEGNGEYNGPEATAVNTAGDLYVADTANNRVQELEPKYSTSNPAPEPPTLGKSAVSTIDYNVGLSGSGLNTMTKSELEKWGQSDDPTEATAIFPPDEPMGWPAKDYKRATVSYLDELGRTVNVATPTGGIATSEYNEDNEITRSLSSDNRAVALKEPNPKEASERLDTKSKYNGESKEEKEKEEKEKALEPGIRLLETLGPEHNVKLEGGTEVQARNHIRYFYDEGAPGEEQYDLVTKTIDGAEIPTQQEEKNVRVTSTSYSGQQNLGWRLRKPTSVTTDPKNGLEGLVRFAFGSVGSGNGEFSEPRGVSVAANGDVYVADTKNDRVEEFSSSGGYLGQFGSKGTGAGQMESPEGVAVAPSGNVFVADKGNSRIDEFNDEDKFVQDFSSEEPVAVAVAADGEVYAVSGDSGLKYAIRKYKESAGKFSVSTEFGEQIKEDKEYEVKCNGEPPRGLKEPRGIAVSPSGNVFVVNAKDNCVYEYNEKGIWKKEYGGEGTTSGKFKQPTAIAVAPNGDVYVADTGNNRVQQFNETGTYLGQFGSEGKENGQFKAPSGIAVAGNGDLWNGALYVADTSNNRIQNWIPPNLNASAHATQTIYYSTQGDPTYPQCNNHPEWANLPCQTQPASQPEDSLPKLPLTTVTYNMWDEPEMSTETIGSTIRTKQEAYDSAGRESAAETSATGSSANPLPKVTDEYNKYTGTLEKQSTSKEEKTKTITNEVNTLGQLVSYTDADGSTTTYTYDIDGRPEEVSYEIAKEKYYQSYSYDPTTGEMTKLLDATAKAFTASYDVEGKMTSESYPNAMTASYTYNSTGEPTAIAYEKTAHCKEKCPEIWFSETSVPSIHGEALERTSTLAKEAYSYDNAGRLTEARETLTGKGCTTRLYVYDEDSNRTSLTTREPGTEGKCATEGGTVEAHSYDEADRLEDSGVTYEALGNITKLPAADAGKSELTSSYYIDNQTASQEQNSETLEYNYDPAGRTRETNSHGTTKATALNHYPSPAPRYPGPAKAQNNGHATSPASTGRSPQPNKMDTPPCYRYTTCKATSSPRPPSAKQKPSFSPATTAQSSGCPSTAFHQNTRG